jgi:hypothetical protein
MAGISTLDFIAETVARMLQLVKRTLRDLEALDCRTASGTHGRKPVME